MDILEIHRALAEKNVRASFPKIKVMTQSGVTAFEGTGFLSQDNTGQFRLDLMVTTTDMHWISNANPHAPVEHPLWFGFKGSDARGSQWRHGEWFRPRLIDAGSAFTSFHENEPFHLIIKIPTLMQIRPSKIGTFDSIKLDSSVCRTEFILPDRFGIPTPGKNVIKTDSSVDGERVTCDHDHYAANYDGNDFRLRLQRDDNFMHGSIKGPIEGFPRFSDQKIREVLMFLTASVFDYSVLARYSADSVSVRLRGRAPASSSMLNAPVEMEDFWTAFSDSINYLFTNDSENPLHHPVFASALDVMASGFGTKANHDVALVVGIEAVLSHCDLADAKNGDISDPDTLQQIRDHQATLEINDTLRRRIDGMLSGLSQWRAKDRMHRLKDLGVVTEKQCSVWNRVRNPAAHGKSLQISGEDYGHLYTALNAVVLTTVGSKVTPIDYGKAWSNT